MEPTYRKSKGNAGQKGVQFQLDLITMCLLNALRKNDNWKISSENPMAGKYDDIVVELAGEAAILIQAKHREKRKITKNQLLSDNSKNSDFSLPKYFFSYEEVKSKFPARTVIICTNTTINTKGLEDILTLQPAQSDSVLYHESNCFFYSLNENILPELKTSAEAFLVNNTRNRAVDKTVVTEEALKDFLKHLQIFSCYPCEDSLHEIIGQSLSRLSCSTLCRNISSQEILKKVEDWFLQPKGEYLTEARAKAMLCEIRSDKYCESLKDFNVSFGSNELDITSSKGITHVKAKGGHLLPILKIHHALHGNKSKQLYVNPEDALEVQKQVVEAFSLRRYKSLIMIWPKSEDVTAKREIVNIARMILQEDKYKQVILVADVDVELAQQFELEDVWEVEVFVKFQDLSDDSQQRLLETNNVLFQGERITLRELLNTQSAEDYTRSLDSAMLEELIRGKEIKVGVRPLLDEDSAQYYVSRRFQVKMGVETEDIPPILTEETFYDVTEKVIVISDSAGMGKSTVITKMAVAIKKTHPSLWVMKINLSDYTRVFRDFAKMKRREINATELLNSLEATKVTNKFETLVFSMKAKVVLLLDGVDEISPDYTDLVLSLLSYCKQAPNFAKIFVTTRPHMTLKLEVIELFQMLPLTKMEQTHFLTNFWMHNLRLDHENKGKCKRYAEILIDKISSWTISKHGQNLFADIPLQIRMLAEIFQENIKSQQASSWEGCKEYLERDGLELKLPEKFNIAELYDTFIEKKQEIFIDKENPYGSGIVSLALHNQFQIYLAYLRSLAVSTILPEYKHLFKSLTSEDKATEEYILKIGIVQRLDGRLHFIHRTFAEYFVAHSVVEELKRKPDANFQQLVIDTIFASNRYKIVLDFLDILLHTVTLPPEIFNEYRCLKLNSNPYLIFQLTTAGYVELLRFILDALHFEIIEGRRTKPSNWRLRRPFRKKNTLNDLEVLLREAGVNIKCEDGETLLHYAVKGGHLDMVHFLVKRGADVNMKSNVFPSLVTSHWRMWNAAKLLVNRGKFRSTCNQGLGALHFAVRSNQIDIVEDLLKHGADVNLKGSFDDTALHTAAYKGNLDVIKCLVEHGADVNSGGDQGLTALHIAAMFNRIDVAEYLLQHGADPALKNSECRMRVYLTARCQQLTSMSSKK